MKKLTTAAVTVCILSALAMAQAGSNDETIVVRKSDLTKEQLAKVDAEEMQKRVDRYGKWVGIGHEVGTAVNESLVAVTANAQNFSNTTPGKVAIFLVVYKVIGRDILGVLISLVILFIGLPIWIWSYRKYIPHSYLVKETVAEDGKHKIREYGYGYSKLDEDLATGWAIGHWVVLAIYTMIALACIF